MCTKSLQFSEKNKNKKLLRLQLNANGAIETAAYFGFM